MATSTNPELLAQIFNSLHLASVRNWRDSEYIWVSGVRMATNLQVRSPGIRGFLSSDVQPLVSHDVLCSVDNLEAREHPIVSLLAASTLMRGLTIVGVVLRGSDPERPDLLTANLLTQGTLRGSGGLRVGTTDHLEGFPLREVSNAGALDGLCLQTQTALDALARSARSLPGLRPEHIVDLSEDASLSIAALLTGMAHAQMGSDDLVKAPLPVSADSDIHLPAGTAVWLFPSRLGESLLTLKPSEMTTLRLYFDTYLMQASESAPHYLLAISGILAPQVKDLIRLVGAKDPPLTPTSYSDSSVRSVYSTVLNADNFQEATRQWRGR